VRHLDDQSIGCQYCVLKCPYDVTQYSERLGIVRKCDMCTGRLGAGEAPVCVQACPHEAIAIEIVERAEVLSRATPGAAMLPGAFDSSYTKPTTRFFSRHPLPIDAKAADEAMLRLEHAHWPLVWMLLLTQMAVGLFMALALSAMSGMGDAVLHGLGGVGWITLQLGLAVSVLHLGRPLGAWRFFLGLRTSWMSREILVFSLFAGMATGATGALWVEPLRFLRPWLAGSVALVGLAGVVTSVMIYVDTHRAFWAARFTGPKFFGATLSLGAHAAALVLWISGAGGCARLAAGMGLILRVGLFAWETLLQRHASETAEHPAHRAMLTMRRFLPWIPRSSAALFAICILSALLAMLASRSPAITASGVAFAGTFAALVLERFCFFTTCPAPRMPGGVAE
jgi:DMSO reductase anchor subunit